MLALDFVGDFLFLGEVVFHSNRDGTAPSRSVRLPVSETSKSAS